MLRLLGESGSFKPFKKKFKRGFHVLLGVMMRASFGKALGGGERRALFDISLAWSTEIAVNNALKIERKSAGSGGRS